MTKRIISLVLLFAVAASLTAGCKEGGQEETTLQETQMESTAPSVTMKPDDGVMNVLMIGNSYCYYYVEELYGLAAAAGIKMRVCNVYYSGCSLQQHWTWWQTKEANYAFFVTDENGRIKEGNKVNLEWCLQQGDWDVISLQMGGGGRLLRNYTVEYAMEATRLYRNDLYKFLKEQFPAADFYFHHSWSYDIGHTRTDGYVMKDRAQQMEYAAKKKEMAIGVCAENEVNCINTGDAWELYREACNAENIPHSLTARLGVKSLDPQKEHSGDGTHDGDIGGGQFLNACVWYEILTGKDCRENPYAPVYTYQGETYTLSEEMLTMLREAAHKAVQEATA